MGEKRSYKSSTIARKLCHGSCPIQTMKPDNWRQSALQELLCVTNRHTKIRPPKSSHHRERHSDNASILVHQWPSGSARSCLCVINNLVRQNVSNMTLRHKRPDQFALRQLAHH